MKSFVPIVTAGLPFPGWAFAACDEPNKQQLDPQPAAAAPARVDDADLAVKADFEADAEQSISTASYKQDLDAAEKELSGK